MATRPSQQYLTATNLRKVERERERAGEHCVNTMNNLGSDSAILPNNETLDAGSSCDFRFLEGSPSWPECKHCLMLMPHTHTNRRERERESALAKLLAFLRLQLN